LAWTGKRFRRFGDAPLRPSPDRTPKCCPEAATWGSLDLCVDLTKLALNIANRFVGCQLGLGQARHFVRTLLFHARAFKGERVAVVPI
jgi:hypothetical protein